MVSQATWKKWVLAVLLAAATPLLPADEALERRLGQDALADGNYRSAIRFFENARQLSESEDDWVENTLLLATATLENGDLEGARALFADFRSRFPARSAGLLPGELLMAERRFTEAEAYFTALAAGQNAPELTCMAGLRIGDARMAAGNFTGAAAVYEQIENENADLPQFALRAHVSRIYALLEGGETAAAERLLAAGRYREADPAAWANLELLAAQRRRDFTAFMAGWPRVRELGDSRFLPLRHLLAVRGAGLALVTGHLPQAASLWNDAFQLATTEEESKTALRERINILAETDPAAAATEIGTYLGYYPNDEERTLLLLRGARLAVAGRDFSTAGRFYRRITADNRIPLDTRLSAAREAASVAVTAGDDEMAGTMLLYFAEQAESAADRLEGSYLLGEHYYRLGEYRKAADEFQKTAEAGQANAERARELQLDSLIQLEAFAEAAPAAELLRNARDRALRIKGEYYRARILEKRGETAAARSEYDRFMAQYPQSEFMPYAMLSAGELELQLKNYRRAAELLFAYAERRPRPADADRALYLAMQAGYFGGLEDVLDKSMRNFDADSPDSTSGIEARLQLADYLIGGGRVVRAETILTDLEQRPTVQADPEIIAEILYRRAQIAIGLQRIDEGAALIARILMAYPETAFAADAAFLAGNLEADAGNYAAAMEHYEKAYKLRPAGSFGLAAKGRVADCRYSIYAESLDRTDLNAAIGLYSELAEDDRFPRIQLQSLYKLGKCLELSDRAGEAVEVFNRVLYLARDLRGRGMHPEPVWVVRAGYAAVTAYQKAGTPAAARDALRVLDMLEELCFETGEELSRRRQEIQRKFNLEGKTI